MKKLGILAATLFATSASAAFRCVDEKGRTHIGDTPPAGCANVVMEEVTRGGVLIRKIEPTLTEAQFKARQEAEEKAKAAEKAVAEQKRKDMALLSTYASEKEFDVARDRNIEPIKARITLSNDREKEIEKRLKTIKEEMEFYKAGKKKGSKDTMPVGLTSELDRLNEEKKSIAKNLVSYDKEIVELKSKYDTDKRRWLALKQGAGSKPAEVATTDAKAEPAKADAKPAPKK